MTPLLLAVLAQLAVDLPASTGAQPVTGSSPAVVFDGTGYVVAWVDDRLDALDARRLLFQPREDLYFARMQPDGGLAAPQRACTFADFWNLTLTANEATGDVYASWGQPSPLGTGLGGALLRPGDAPTCLPLAFESSDSLEYTHTRWTGTRRLLAFVRNGITLHAAWFDANGALVGGPTTLRSDHVGNHLSLGKATGGARLLYWNNLGRAVGFDLAENGTAPATGSERDLGPAAALTLDPEGAFAVLRSTATVSATWFDDGGVLPLGVVAGTERLAVTTARTVGRSLLAMEGATQVTLRHFTRDGGFTTLATFGGESEVALASDGVSALVATSAGLARELRWRRVPLGPVAGNPGPAQPFAVVPAAQRWPSVAWAGDRWLVVYEEWNGQAFAPRARWVSDDGQRSDGVALQPGISAPVILARPDGRLLMRVDVGATTVTQPVALDAMSGALDSVGGPLLSTVEAPAGAATNVAAAHWTGSLLRTQGVPDGIALPGLQVFRAAAALPGDIVFPVQDGVMRLSTMTVDDGVLTSALGSFAPVLTSHSTQFDRQVTPALAANVRGARSTVLLAWLETTGRLAVRTIAGGSAGQVAQLSVSPPVRGLAAAPADDGFVLVWADRQGVQVANLSVTGTVASTERLDASGELAGEPVAAGSPSGQVAVVWPAFVENLGTVQLRMRLLGGMGNRDAGVDAGRPDAGDADAGAPDAGTPDGGVADAGAADGGAPDAGAGDGGAGVDLLVFDTSGCGCNARAVGGAWWALALAAGAALARRRRR